MKENMKAIKKVLVLIGFISISASADLITVNGKVIDQATIDYNVKSNVERGAENNDALKNAVRDELVLREIIYQKAIELKFDKEPLVKIKMDQAQKTMLGELLIEWQLKKNPVTLEEVRKQYEKESADLKDAEEYNLRVIVVADKDKIEEVQKKINNGDDFAKLASTYSVDNTKKNGGELGWVLPGQVIPSVSSVMVNLSKGSVSKQPIPTQVGWQFIKVEDKRSFKMPKFEDAKAGIEAYLKQKRRVDFIKSLRDAAKIK